RNGTQREKKRKRSREQGEIEKTRERIGRAKGKIVRAQSRVAERESSPRGATKMERRTGSTTHGARARAASRRAGQGKRDSIRTHSRIGKETGSCRGKDGERSPITVACRSDRGTERGRRHHRGGYHRR